MDQRMYYRSTCPSCVVPFGCRAPSTTSSAGLLEPCSFCAAVPSSAADLQRQGMGSKAAAAGSIMLA
jgi:hypothetical protein